MVRMILRRLALGAITVFLVSTIIFTGVELLPGDACTAFLQRDAQGKLLDNCRAELGLNRPAVERYVEWASGALTGDLSVSAKGRQPISEIVGIRLRNTLLLASGAALIGVPLALVFGVWAALRRDRVTDLAISTLAIGFMTVPEFVSATVMILVFSIWLNWLSGIIIVSPDAPLIEFVPKIVLPVLVLTFVMTAHILRTVRSSVINTLATEFVQMAVLKGVPYWQIIIRHVLPNALLPVINVVALTIAWLLGGVVVIETVFNYPGLGRLMIDSITDRDLPVTQAIALIIATIYVGVNLAADILAMMVNPRLRTLKARQE
jgi:peptide/nickel transport system permease protein